jgi:hypothetical protein
MNKKAMGKSLPTLSNGNNVSGDGGNTHGAGTMGKKMAGEIHSKTSPYKEGSAPRNTPRRATGQ